MSSFQHSNWSDNKRCTVEVGWSIFIEKTTIFFLVPNSGRKYSIKNSPWLLLRKMIISQLELGLPGYIENLDLTNLRKNNQIVRYVKGWLIILFLIIIFFCGVTSRYPAFWDRNGYCRWHLCFNVYKKLQL